MPMKPLATVRIKIETRDGTIYITSNDVPGLWLWGRDPDKLFQSVIPTIAEIYKHNNNNGEAVKVVAAPVPKKERWFSAEKINDLFEIYPAAKLNEHTGLRP